MKKVILIVALVAVLFTTMAAIPLRNASGTIVGLPGGKTRTYIGEFVQDGKFLAESGAEFVVPAGSYLYDVRALSRTMVYGCLTYQMSMQTCGKTAKRNIIFAPKVEP